MFNKPFIYALLGIALLSFIIGWIFPVEGPLDSAYEDLVKIKKGHQKGVAAPKAKKEVILMDEDEIELYYLVPSSFIDDEDN